MQTILLTLILIQQAADIFKPVINPASPANTELKKVIFLIKEKT